MTPVAPLPPAVSVIGTCALLLIVVPIALVFIVASIPGVDRSGEAAVMVWCGRDGPPHRPARRDPVRDDLPYAPAARGNMGPVPRWP